MPLHEPSRYLEYAPYYQRISSRETTLADSPSSSPISQPDAANREIVALFLIIAVALALRYAMAPQLDGLDDAGYLEAANRVAQGRSLENMFPLFRTRVGMAYPLGWLLKGHLLAPGQYWVLTTLAESVTLVALFLAAWRLTSVRRAGVLTALLYAVYPFAVQQSGMFYPSAFQTMFIAVALALIASAERAVLQWRAIAGLSAGIALGLAYLVKEDAALLVPALTLAGLLTGFPRRSTVFYVCVGAATVFLTETAGYFLTTGNALFRLRATSGLGGSTISSQLQISDIFKWDAYLRSLYLMPIQVGLAWWLVIPSIWVALRRSDARMRFVASLFLLVGVYLQFGSDSLSSYAPLPKTPRYTVIVVPLLMVMIGAWLAHLYANGCRFAAKAVIVATVAVAVPCLIFLDITSSERSRNILTVADMFRRLPPAPVYTDFYSARGLRILAPELADVRVWYHANFQTNQMMVQSDPNQTPGAYVVLDLQSAKIYTSSYQLTLPAAIAGPHAGWEKIWSGRAYESDSVSRHLLEFVRSTATRIVPGDARRRVESSVANIIDRDQVTLFRVK